MKNPKGIGNILLILLGLILAGTLLGFLRNSSLYTKNGTPKSGTISTNKNIPQVNLPNVPYPEFMPSQNSNTYCGLNLNSPNLISPVSFPATFSGFVDGCDWSMVNGYAGTVQIFDYDNTPLTNVLPLNSLNNSDKKFSVVIVLNQPSKAGRGYVVFKNNSFGSIPQRVINSQIIFK